MNGPALKLLIGKTLAQVAAERGKTPGETALDLVAEDRSRIFVAYTLMAPDNLVTEMRQPWMSVASDGEAVAPEGVFLRSATHPRTYGSFVRVLAGYSRATERQRSETFLLY